MSVRAATNDRPSATSRTTVSQRRPAGLTVRPAAAGDLAPLAFFFDALLRDDYFIRRGQLKDILAGKRHRVFVAELDAILVGAAITTRGSGLVNALVHPAYRGLGIGRALVRCSGARSVRAKLDMSTGDPRGFYHALGFEPTGCFNAKGNIEVMRLRRRAAAGCAGRAKSNGKPKRRNSQERNRQRSSTRK